jgi:hypothetical protein
VLGYAVANPTYEQSNVSGVLSVNQLISSQLYKSSLDI